MGWEDCQRGTGGELGLPFVFMLVLVVGCWCSLPFVFSRGVTKIRIRILLTVSRAVSRWASTTAHSTQASGCVLSPPLLCAACSTSGVRCPPAVLPCVCRRVYTCLCALGLLLFSPHAVFMLCLCLCMRCGTTAARGSVEAGAGATHASREGAAGGAAVPAQTSGRGGERDTYTLERESVLVSRRHTQEKTRNSTAACMYIFVQSWFLAVWSSVPSIDLSLQVLVQPPDRREGWIFIRVE